MSHRSELATALWAGTLSDEDFLSSAAKEGVELVVFCFQQSITLNLLAQWVHVSVGADE